MQASHPYEYLQDIVRRNGGGEHLTDDGLNTTRFIKILILLYGSSVVFYRPKQ